MSSPKQEYKSQSLSNVELLAFSNIIETYILFGTTNSFEYSIVNENTMNCNFRLNQLLFDCKLQQCAIAIQIQIYTKFLSFFCDSQQLFLTSFAI